MAESEKNFLVHIPETGTCRLLRPINTAVVEPQKKFAGAWAPTVPYDSDVEVPVKHDFSETFEREKFDGFFG